MIYYMQNTEIRKRLKSIDRLMLAPVLNVIGAGMVMARRTLGDVDFSDMTS